MVLVAPLTFGALGAPGASPRTQKPGGSSGFAKNERARKAMERASEWARGLSDVGLRSKWGGFGIYKLHANR